MQDWQAIYGRQLIETPPLEVWAAAYFGHKPSTLSANSADADDVGEWDSGLPETTE